MANQNDFSHLNFEWSSGMFKYFKTNNGTFHALVNPGLNKYDIRRAIRAYLSRVGYD